MDLSERLQRADLLPRLPPLFPVLAKQNDPVSLREVARSIIDVGRWFP
jgi:hypothetical protein